MHLQLDTAWLRWRSGCVYISHFIRVELVWPTEMLLVGPLANATVNPYTFTSTTGFAQEMTAQALHPHDHRHCIDDALTRAESVCAERGAKMTPLRRRVLELVWDSHAPVGAYAIMDMLRAADDRAAAPPTVYRALEFLLEQGLVHKIESLNAFVGCDRPEERHISQFLICTSCKAAIELNDPSILQAIEQSAKQLGFSLNRLTIEAQGLCASCRTGREAA